jgi:hypothetical protein
MKLLFLFLLLYSTGLLAQGKYALIDPSLKTAIKYSDTIHNPSRSIFIIRSEDVTGFLRNVHKYISLMSKVHRSNFAMAEDSAGSTTLKAISIGKAYGDGYNISAETKVGSYVSSMVISNARFSNKINIDHMERLIKYISEGKAYKYYQKRF